MVYMVINISMEGSSTAKPKLQQAASGSFVASFLIASSCEWQLCLFVCSCKCLQVSCKCLQVSASVLQVSVSGCKWSVWDRFESVWDNYFTDLGVIWDL